MQHGNPLSKAIITLDFSHSQVRRSKLTKISVFLKTMIPDCFLWCGAFLKHNPVNKWAKNKKRMSIAALFHLVDLVQKDR